MADGLNSSGGKGREIMEVLMLELGVPGRSKWFEVRFEVGEPVTVRCEYVPVKSREPEIEHPGEPIIETFDPNAAASLDD